MKALTSVLEFLKTDVWKINEAESPLPKRVAIRFLRVLLLTFHGFTEDRIHLRASALTFYTLLSIVPVLAMAFGVAKGFGFEDTLKTFIIEKLEGQEEVARQIVDFAVKLLENVKGGLVAGIGLVILLYTVLKILSHIESSFNDIWGIESHRPFFRQITDYFSIMFIGPIFFIVSSALSVFLTSGAREATQRIWLLAAVGPAIFFSLKLLPILLLWVLFTILYLFMPNTRVKFIPALIAGIITGLLLEFFQGMYIDFQVGVAKYNAIYGSFAALPLFFIWLQFSWLIVLFGAEIAYACQHHTTHRFEKEIRSISPYTQKLLALQIVHFLVSHFSGSKTSWKTDEISQALDIPRHMIRGVMRELESAGMVSQLVTEDNSPALFQPAKDPGALTIKSVIDALDQRGDNELFLPESETLQKLSQRMKVFSDLVAASPANQCLKEI
jgi:membrane protein